MATPDFDFIVPYYRKEPVPALDQRDIAANPTIVFHAMTWGRAALPWRKGFKQGSMLSVEKS